MMATSRLEKIGTIFTRTTALLKTGAMRPEDKPIWYDIYKALPPKLEPSFARPAPKIDIRQIFYAEDKVRAKFHKFVKQTQNITLNSTFRATESQMFIEIYKKLEGQGPLSDEKIFETALEMLEEKLQSEKDARNATREDFGGLVQNYKDSLESAVKASTTTSVKAENVDLRDIFKE